MRRPLVLLLVLVGGCRVEQAATAPRPSEAAAPADEPAPAPDRAAVVAELRASFPALAGYRPAPDLQLPPWLSQDTVWFAEAGRCFPIRRVPDAPKRRALEFCSVPVEFDLVRCWQPADLDGLLQIRGSYDCTYGNEHGGGGWGNRGSHMVDRTGKSFAGDAPGMVEGRGQLTHPPTPTTWAPIAVLEDHVVFAEAWLFAVRDETPRRVETTCDPDSLARVREQARRDAPTASPAELAATLRERLGVEADGTRRCVEPGDERLQRGREPLALAFTPRIRNVRTEDIVDCSEPCPDDQTRRARIDAFLAATRFVAESGGESLVLYASRVACQAGARRSTVGFSTKECHSRYPPNEVDDE